MNTYITAREHNNVAENGPGGLVIVRGDQPHAVLSLFENSGITALTPDTWRRTMYGQIPLCVAHHLSAPTLQQDWNAVVSCADPMPVIVIADHADVQTAVRAMQAGVVSFLQAPFLPEELFDAVRCAWRVAVERTSLERTRAADRERIARLTAREREVLCLAAVGHPTKVIAVQLGVSKRTVDKHRQHILAKTGASSWATLVALALRMQMDSRTVPERLLHSATASAARAN